MKTGLLQELSVAPEVAYVLGLCRRDSLAGIEESPLLPGEGFDWESVLRYAARHRLGPTIYWRLRGLGFPGVPEAVREKLDKGFRTTVGTNLAFTRLFVGLLGQLEGERVRVIALKGPVAAFVHHGNLAARQFGDLDLLVPREHAPRALAVLRALGFAPDVPLGERHFRILLRTRRELKLTHPTGWVVDLHWESMETHLSWCGGEALWSRSVEVDFEGRPVRTLGSVDLALYYCLKAAEDGWGTAYQLLDTALALEVLGAGEWDHLIAWARGAGKWRAVGTSIVLAHELLGVFVPPGFLGEVAGRRDVRELAAGAAPRMLSSDWPGLGFPRLVVEQLRCLDCWRDKVSLLRMLTLQPGERDLTLLPAWLVFSPLLQIVRVGRTVGNLATAAFGTHGRRE
ncbi:MAG: nucleotidyltransferase family protein [Polyangiaceae bacterium]|nr:nucleotidyltransferase family protein [Polyangiaceae bacterium]